MEHHTNYAFTDADITEDEAGLEGNRLADVPEHNFNLWTTYDIQDGPLEAVRLVRRAFGETEIPANPTRVVVLGHAAVEAAVVHGVQPIGAPGEIIDEMLYLSLDASAIYIQEVL